MKYAFAILVLTIFGTLVTPFSLNEAFASGTLYGADRAGNLFTINVNNGNGALVGLMPFASTEIECTENGIFCYSQQPDGSFTSIQFNIADASLLLGPIPNSGSHTGLEHVGSGPTPPLYATVIFGGGGAAPSELHTLVQSTGVSTLIGPTGVGAVSGLAFDTCTDTMYGIAGGPGPADLYTIDLNTGTATVVGTTSIQAGSLQFGPDGKLYAGGTGPDAGNLFIINPSDATSTLVGSTGFGPVTGLTLVGQVECDVVGGKLLQIDSTALILAGVQSTSWMIPILLSGIGIGLFVVSRNRNNDLQ